MLKYATFSYFLVNYTKTSVLCGFLQNAAMRHIHLNSFSTEPQSATYGINQFSDLSQMEFRGE